MPAFSSLIQLKTHPETLHTQSTSPGSQRTIKSVTAELLCPQVQITTNK